MTTLAHLTLAFLLGCHLGLCFWPKAASPKPLPVKTGLRIKF